MKAAVVMLGCLVVLASTQALVINEAQEKELVKWITKIILSKRPPVVTTEKPPKPQRNCPPCKCGTPRVRRRIVGGVETGVLEYPWMALLMHHDGRFYCGGSVINDLYVLTTAHCVAGFSANDLSVKLLEHDRFATNLTKPIIRKVAAIIKYSAYNPYTADNDIALLKLDEKLDISRTTRRVNDDYSSSSSSESDEDEDLPGVRSVCLPPGGLTFSESKGMVIGWGAIAEGGALSSKLLEVTVPIMSNAKCRKTGYATGPIPRKITDNMLCAGEPEGRYDACQGDSGGPLHVLNSTTGTYMEVGVVSWGEGCARPNYPGVYTRVNRYLTWIKSNTQDACYCS